MPRNTLLSTNKKLQMQDILTAFQRMKKKKEKENENEKKKCMV